MKILVTGSRKWDDPKFIEGVLVMFNRQGGICVVHGDCPQGVDAIAKAVCDKHQIAQFPYPACWEILGTGAGVLRNTEMLVSEAPDCVMAFWDGLSRGTADMVKKALRNGTPVRRYTKYHGDPYIQFEYFERMQPTLDEMFR